jgi:hypothetical protein
VKSLHTTLAAALALAACSNMASAGELATPLLPMLAGTDRARCYFTNLNSSPVSVEWQMIHACGDPASFTGGPGTVEPGETATSESFGDADMRCVFHFSGSRKRVRAHLCIVNSNIGGTCVTRADAE